MKAFSKKMCTNMYAPIGTMPVRVCAPRTKEAVAVEQDRPPVAVVSIAMPSAYASRRASHQSISFSPSMLGCPPLTRLSAAGEHQSMAWTSSSTWLTRHRGRFFSSSLSAILDDLLDPPRRSARDADM